MTCFRCVWLMVCCAWPVPGRFSAGKHILAFRSKADATLRCAQLPDELKRTPDQFSGEYGTSWKPSEVRSYQPSAHASVDCRNARSPSMRGSRSVWKRL